MSAAPMQGMSAIGLNPVSPPLQGGSKEPPQAKELKTPEGVGSTSAAICLRPEPWKITLFTNGRPQAMRKPEGAACPVRSGILGAKYPVPQLINRVCIQQVFPAAVGLG